MSVEAAALGAGKSVAKIVVGRWLAGRASKEAGSAELIDMIKTYGIVLQEGRSVGILAYVDGALLADLRDDLVLPRRIREAWEQVVCAARPAPTK